MPLRQLVDRRFDLREKAPISEALVDIQIPRAAPADLSALNQLRALWGAEYPEGIRTQTEWMGQVSFEKDPEIPTITSQQGIKGYIFLSKDNERAIQARRDGFAFSLLRPYSSWEILLSSARARWTEYKNVVSPTKVSRVALRYTNQFLLPSEWNHLSKWLNTFPQSPVNLGGMTDFFCKTIITHPEDSRYKAAVTIATTSPTPVNTISVGPANLLLDIDVFIEAELSEDAEIWEKLEDLHTFKNDVFFGSITDPTIDLLRR